MLASATTEERKFQDREVTPVYKKNDRATKPVVINVGGADSSKSFSLAQLFIGKLTSERNKNFLVCRKTLPSLRITAYRLVIDLLKEYGFYGHMKHNKSELSLQVAGLNNFLLFASIDDPEKYKSAEFNYIWMEEANEFTWYDFITLKKCRRAKTTKDKPNTMYLTFNPSDEHGWIREKLYKESDVEIIHSTYQDNRFAAEEDIAVLEGLREEDEAYWLIYAKGKFARVKGQIHELLMMSGPYPDCEETIYGLDFGFVNPNALLKIDIDIEHMSLYVTELLHESGMTNAQLKQRLKELILEEDRGREIYADSAEPARIEEIGHEGFNIHPADKEKKSVVNGIDCVNRFKIFSREENVRFNREMNGYKRKTDRKGDVLEEPVKFRDHGPNALRYAVYTHLRDRLIDSSPAWAVHTGMKEEKEPKDEAAKADISNERKGPEGKPSPPTREDSEPLVKPDSKPSEKKVDPKKKKEPRDDESWVL